MSSRCLRSSNAASTSAARSRTGKRLVYLPELQPCPDLSHITEAIPARVKARLSSTQKESRQ